MQLSCVAQGLLRRVEGFVGSGADRGVAWQWTQGGLVLALPAGSLGPRCRRVPDCLPLHVRLLRRLLRPGAARDDAPSCNAHLFCHVALDDLPLLPCLSITSRGDDCPAGLWQMKQCCCSNVQAHEFRHHMEGMGLRRAQIDYSCHVEGK